MSSNKVSLKEEAAKLMEIKGNVRGEVLRVNVAYIRFREGEEGLILVQERLRELGFSLKLKGFKSLKWYPESLSVLIILISKEIFNWKDKDIFEMGNCAPKSSFIVQLLMRHFLNQRKSFEESPKYWKAHFDFGELEVFEINEKAKYFTILIKGYKFHPIMCIYYSGYFLRIVQFIVKSEKITIEEKRCVFKGDSFHEYIIKWE